MLELSLTLYLTSLLAGFLMFLAPCTLPLIPPFLAYISGVDNSDGLRKKKLILNTAAFCLGFTVVFVILGGLVGYISSTFSVIHLLVTKLSGIILLLLGLSILGAFTIFTKSSSGLPLPKTFKRGSVIGSTVLGAVFAVGWSPCIGPIMATILLLAATEGTLLAGLTLLLVFSIGLSVPFFLTALFYNFVSQKLIKYAYVSNYLLKFAGILLVLLGILTILGLEGLLLDYGTRLFYFLRLEFIFNYY